MWSLRIPPLHDSHFFFGCLLHYIFFITIEVRRLMRTPTTTSSIFFDLVSALLIPHRSCHSISAHCGPRTYEVLLGVLFHPLLLLGVRNTVTSAWQLFINPFSSAISSKIDSLVRCSLQLTPNKRRQHHISRLFILISIPVTFLLSSFLLRRGRQTIRVTSSIVLSRLS